MARDTDNNGGVNRRRTSWRIPGIALLCILAACWLVWGPFGIFCYVGGLFNSMYVFVFLFCAMLPGLVFAAAFPVLVVRAAVTWRRRTRLGRWRIIIWVVFCGGFILPVVLGIAGGTSTPFDMFVRGFSRYAERRVEVQAIRDWLGTLDSSDDAGEKSMVDTQLAESEWPPCIVELAPRFVMVQADDAGRPTVRLLWGSGFIGSWGIEVGPEDMPTPSSDASGAGEQRYPLAAGAYIWSSE